MPGMEIRGLHLLEDFKQSHADCRGALDSWRKEVEKVRWANSHEIKQRYASASFLSESRVVFNLKGNRYRLALEVAYTRGVVLIVWVGTHAEYDKKKF